MRAPVVMDSSAMIAIALAEPRARLAEEAIRAHPRGCFILSIHAYEVAAKLTEKGIDLPGAWRAATFGGVRMVNLVTAKMAFRAAEIKMARRDLSLGDCHCLAFAEGMNGCLLTTDGRMAEFAAGNVMDLETIHLH